MGILAWSAFCPQRNFGALCCFFFVLNHHDGSLGAIARARGTYGVVAVGTVLYHIATVAGLYGMSRFRLPLEPLWMIYLALLIAQPRETLQLLRLSKLRIAGAILMMPTLFWLFMWYFWELVFLDFSDL